MSSCEELAGSSSSSSKTESECSECRRSRFISQKSKATAGPEKRRPAAQLLLVSHFLLMVVDDMHDGWNAVSRRMKISVNERMNAGGKHNN